MMMLKERVAVAKDVKDKLLALENAIDEALICASELTTSCAKGRAKADLSAIAGEYAIAMVGAATGHLHEARQKAVKAHSDLAAVRDQLGLPTYASGGGWKPPQAINSGLKIVESDDDTKVA